ncbi:MAG: hypothetical protein WB988_03995, partial [Candidatus Nitrosopolaris sp.]
IMCHRINTKKIVRSYMSLVRHQEMLSKKRGFHVDLRDTFFCLQTEGIGALSATPLLLSVPFIP